MTTMSRVMEGTETSQLVAMEGQIGRLVSCAKFAEALVVFKGMGERWRVSSAVKLFNDGIGAYLLIAGGGQKESVFVDTSLHALQQNFGLRKTRGVFIDDDNTRFTNGQADWASDKIKELKITSAALFVSQYHLQRAWRTLLRSLTKIGLDESVSIVPGPMKVSPDEIIPVSGISGWDSQPAELPRIERYQPNDVATYQEVQKHLVWFWKYSLLAKYL